MNAVVVKRRKSSGPRGSYSVEERARAVDIVRNSPYRTVRDIAADLGLNDKTLNKWVVDARRRELDPEGSMSDAAKRRIERLEAENARLQKELDFQKKARAFIEQIRANRNGSL